MALIACPKCGKEISDKAKQCVGCGWKVDLNILNAKEDETLSHETDLKIDMFHIEEERKKRLKETELEIEKMKEHARQEVKSITESAETLATQKQKELELEYKKKEKELVQKKELLEKSQKELERTKKEHTPELQHTVTVERKTNFPNINALFMVITTVIMMCFMVIVWRKLDKFSAEIEFLTSNNQTESEMQVSNTENIANEELESNGQENIFSSDLNNEENVSEVVQNEETERVSENVENAVSTDNDAVSVEDSNVSFEFTGNDVKFGDVYIYVKITNTGETPVFLTSQKFHYLNDVSIEKAYSQLDTEILSGKSSLLEIRFDTDKLKAAGISTIDSFTYQYNIVADADSEDLTPGEITFNELGITY